MERDLFWVVFILGIVGVVIPLRLYGSRRIKRRLNHYANTRGFGFVVGGVATLPMNANSKGFRVFAKPVHNVLNEISGTVDELSFSSFDYEGSVIERRRGTEIPRGPIVTAWVVLISDSAADFPHIMIRKRSVGMDHMVSVAETVVDSVYSHKTDSPFDDMFQVFGAPLVAQYLSQATCERLMRNETLFDRSDVELKDGLFLMCNYRKESARTNIDTELSRAFKLYDVLRNA